MSVRHDATHEAALQRWAVREELSVEERDLLDGCEVCRARRTELEELTAELEELGARERASELEEARHAPAPEWEDRALSALENSMQGAGARRVGPSPTWLVAGLAAAAAVVALVLLFGPGSAPDPAGRFWLQQEGLSGMSPVREVDRVDEFTWEHATPPLGSYRLDLYLPGESSAFFSTTTYETRWSPDLPAPLPERFLWEVRALDAEGEVKAFGRAEVLVSPQ